MANSTRDSARNHAIRQAQGYWQQRPLFLDTETTGKYTDTAEIVEISVVDHEGAVLLDTLVKPKKRIPAEVIAIHGITNDMVRGAPAWPDVWPAVERLIAGRCVGIYNAAYDVPVMQGCHRRAGLAWAPGCATFFCVMKLYAQFRGEPGLYGDYRWHKLEEAGRHCRIDLPNCHRTLGDSLLARAVLEYVVRCA